MRRAKSHGLRKRRPPGPVKRAVPAALGADRHRSGPGLGASPGRPFEESRSQSRSRRPGHPRSQPADASPCRFRNDRRSAPLRCAGRHRARRGRGPRSSRPRRSQETFTSQERRHHTSAVDAAIEDLVAEQSERRPILPRFRIWWSELAPTGDNRLASTDRNRFRGLLRQPRSPSGPELASYTEAGDAGTYSESLPAFR